MDKQQPKLRQHAQQQQSQALNQLQQHLQETEGELDAQLEQKREEEHYEHFALTPTTIKAASTTSAPHVPPQTMNPAQLLQNAVQRQRAERAQYENSAQIQRRHDLGRRYELEELQEREQQQQQNRDFPFFAIPEIAHDVTYPHYTQVPQKQQASLPRFWFGPPQRRTVSGGHPNGEGERQHQQDRQPRSFELPQYPAQPEPMIGMPQHQPARNLQQPPSYQSPYQTLAAQQYQSTQYSQQVHLNQQPTQSIGGQHYQSVQNSHQAQYPPQQQQGIGGQHNQPVQNSHHAEHPYQPYQSIGGQQNQPVQISQQAQHLPQPTQNIEGQHNYGAQNVQQGEEAGTHKHQSQASQNPKLPRPLSPESQAKLSRSYVGANLDSKSQTEVPEFHFPIEGFSIPRAMRSTRVDVGSASEGGQLGKEPSLTGTSKSPFPGPIAILHTPNVVTFCILVKNFLRQCFGNEVFGTDGILRLETLDLWKLEGEKEGYVVMADDACRVSISEPKKTEVWKPTYYTKEGEKREQGVTMWQRKWVNASVFAVLVPKKGSGMRKGGIPFAWEHDVRFFWSILPIWPALKTGDRKGLTVLKDFQPGNPKHKQLTTWLRDSFLSAVIPPHSEDFKKAMHVTDYCPSMLDPDNALKRLHCNDFLYFAAKDALNYGSDLSDDRYFHHIHPAEREAASLAELTCAGYLWVKRSFFKAFYEDIYRSDKEIDPNTSATRSGRGVATQTQSQTPVRQRTRGCDEAPDREDTPMSTIGTPAATPAGATPASPASAQSRVSRTAARKVRVRTETAHQRWLKETFDMPDRRARCLVTCWKEFGFLEEGRYLDWLRAGGMFEDGEAEDPDGDKEED